MTTVEESSSSSAEIMGSSHDLLSEILPRLPVKSLVKFKSVSKQWLSLITHPQFSRRKCHNPTQPPSALFLQYPYLFDGACGLSIVHLDPSNSQETAPLTTLVFPDHPHGIEIMHSCNDLFCCRSVELGDSSKPKHYYVYNPTTKQFATLPPLLHCVSGVPQRVLGLNLAFDPSHSHSYRVICVQSTQSGNILDLFTDNYQIQIYSSESRSWRLSGGLKPFGAPLRVNFSCGVYWNGSIHWVSASKGLVYLDVEEGEVIRDMPLPSPASPNYCDGSEDRDLREWQGHLHLVESYHTFDLEYIVYEMERDRSGWIVKFSVDPNRVQSAVPEALPYYSEDGFYSLVVLCVVREEKEEDSFAVLLVRGGIIGYNFKSKSLWKICNVDGRSVGRTDRFWWFKTFQYIESLSPVQS